MTDNYYYTNSNNTTTTTNVTVNNFGGSYSVVGQPSIGASFIDQLLCKYNSPACNTGNTLYTDGKAANIDPAYALAFFLHESTFGKYGVAHDNLGLGNIRCTQGYSCNNGFRAYPSWETGYKDWYALMNSSTYIGGGLTTVDQIIPRYAPNGDNNNEAGYIAALKQSVDLWRSGAVSIP